MSRFSCVQHCRNPINKILTVLTVGPVPSNIVSLTNQLTNHLAADNHVQTGTPKDSRDAGGDNREKVPDVEIVGAAVKSMVGGRIEVASLDFSC